MLLVAPVRAERRLPVNEAAAGCGGSSASTRRGRASRPVTHVDYSARVQTVTADAHPAYHALLAAFEARTGCPVLVNTSFNVRGEPIVCTPEDAYRCFMRTHLDHLVLGPFLLAKAAQPGAAGGAATWAAELQRLD
jgi:carbamoyltransferase